MDQSVTVTFVPERLITWAIIGLIAGLFAGLLIRGRRFGFVSSVVVGALGAVLGGFLFSVLRIQMSPALSGGITLAWADMLVAFVGAVIILLLFGGFIALVHELLRSNQEERQAIGMCSDCRVEKPHLNAELRGLAVVIMHDATQDIAEMSALCAGSPWSNGR